VKCDPWMNYEDDDTVTVGCHSHGWMAGNHPNEDEAEASLAAHKEANKEAGADVGS